ncbi:ABC transporter substrate-binding protein [Planotetraspora thailandica]|uniref:ABC transporter substrate-binding protein n=1 Tax=Planotetraspora thailandica TaxID=487172 RepID=A0A8J3XX77_9ACTN|nr:ABC transporter substrate-binding protein [Planotetraspora thailandica]GII52593.1 ABC transporter substrate-binding protein [Planotetraspora thailandica]
MRTSHKVLTALVPLAALLAACGHNTQDAQGAKNSTAAFDPATCQGGTLRVLNQGDLTHYDPARLYTSGGGKIPTLLFRTLTTRNRVPGPDSTKVVPDLATDVGTPSDDAKTWTYHLKDGLKFEDGTPITSADIKYGIERSFAPELPGGAPYLRDWLKDAQNYGGPYKDGELSSIETPDDKTIIFKLRKPEGEFPYLATATQFAPVPKAKDTGVDYEKHPISSGPYKVESFDQSKHLVLVRNDNWSRQIDDQRLACPDRIEVTAGLDPAVVNQRLATGAGDDANAATTDVNLGPAELARLGSDPQLAAHVAHTHFGDTTYLAFNPKVKPFDDIKVREAISYAVNRQTVINAVGGSQLADPATTFLPDQAVFGYQPYDHFPAGPTGDPAKAKELLAQAGYPNGLTITLTHSTAQSGHGPGVATAIQDALKQAGITVNLEPLDPDSFDAKVNTPATEPGLSIDGWGADWPSGNPFLAPIFDGRQIIKSGGNFNLAQYDNPEVNDEIDAINKLTDPAAAAKRWGALDEKIGKEALTVPLYHSKDLLLFGKNVKNAWVSDWNGLYDLSVMSVK